MKKISIISAIALSALVYSCKKDKDSNEEPKKKPAQLIVNTPCTFFYGILLLS